MIVGRDNVIAWMQEMETPYWTLYKDQKGAKIAESSDAPNLTIEASLERLKKIFDFTGGGRFFLVIKQSPENTKAGLYQDIIELHGQPVATGSAQVGCGPSCGCGKGVAGIGAVTHESVEAAITKAKAEWEKDQEIKQLKEQITELKSEGRMGAFVRALEPILPKIGAQIVQRLTPPARSMAVAGWPPAEAQAPTIDITNEQMESNTARIQQALERLDAVLEPEGIDIVEVMEALASKAEADKPTILMALNMLGIKRN